MENRFAYKKCMRKSERRFDDPLNATKGHSTVSDSEQCDHLYHIDHIKQFIFVFVFRFILFL